MDDFDDFDYDGIVSQSVLDHELTAARIAGNQDLIEKLEMATTLMETNADAGLLTPEVYRQNVQNCLQQYKKLVAAGNKHAQKMQLHVEMMEKELKDMEEQQGEEEPPPQPSISHRGSLFISQISLRSQQSQGPMQSLSLRIQTIKNEPSPAPPEPAQPLSVHDQLMQSNAMFRFCYLQLQEAKHAFEYMRSFGVTDRMEAVLHKAESYQKTINDFRAGRPPSGAVLAFSPKDLFGMKEADRQAQITALVAEVKELAAMYKEKALAALKGGDKEEAAVLKGKMTLNERHAQRLESLRVNPWQPLPKISSETILDRVRKVNEALPENVLRIDVGEVAGVPDSDSVYVAVSLSLQSGESSFKTRTEKARKLKFQQTVQLAANQMQSLDTRRVTVELFSAQGESLGTQSFKLTELESKCTLQNAVALTRRGLPSVKLTFSIRKALKVPEFSTVQRQQLSIVGFIPPFKYTDGTLNQLQQGPKEESKEQPAPAKKDQPPPIPAGIAPEELQNPSVLQNLNSHEVLDSENKRLMELIPRLRADGKDVSRWIEQQRAVSRKLITLQVQADKGIVTPEEYRSVLQQSLAHDQLLLRAFQDRQQNDKVQIVARRIALMQKELAEMP